MSMEILREKMELLKSTLTVIIIIFCVTNGTAQFWQEDFETDGEGVRYSSTGAYFGNINNHFGRTDGNNITGGYSAYDGVYFWATEDSDDPLGPDGFLADSLLFEGIDISGYSWLLFRGLFGEGPGNNWDSDDSLAIEYRIDGGVWELFMNFDTPAIGIDLGMFYDTNLDGLGDGDNLNASFDSFEKDLFVSGNLMDIRVFFKTDIGGEEVAIDFFQLFDASALTPGCMDLNALNYNPGAEMEDGSCYDYSVVAFDFSFSPDFFVIEIGQTINWINLLGIHNIDGTFDAINGVDFTNPENFFFAAGPEGTEWQYTFNTPGHYDYNCSIGDHALNGMVGGFDVGLGGCMNIQAVNYNSIAEFDDNTCEILGCMDLLAVNFNVFANLDDGSCQISGCTYLDAQNYNPDANVDDGTCSFSNVFCSGDTDGNNVVNILDLVNVSSNFGAVCP